MRWLTLPFWNATEGRLRAPFRVALQFGIFIGLSALIGRAFQGADEARARNTEALFSVGVLFLVWTFVAIFTVWLGRAKLDHRSLESLGLRVDRRWALDFGFGVGLGGLLMVGILGTELALGWSAYEPIGALGGDVPRIAFAPMALFAFVGVAIYEELIFRGYQLVNIADGISGRWVGPRAALLIAAFLSSVAFGLAHLGNPGASVVSSINIAAAGLMLASAFLATGELAIPMGLHLGWNLFQNLFGMPVSGQDHFFFASALRRVELGPDWLTGGGFGPEAGMTGLTASVVGTLAILLWVRIFNGRVGLHASLVDPLNRRAER